MVNQFGFREEFQGDLKNYCYHDHVIGSSSKVKFYLVREEGGGKRERERVTKTEMHFLYD